MCVPLDRQRTTKRVKKATNPIICGKDGTKDKREGEKTKKKKVLNDSILLTLYYIFH